MNESKRTVDSIYWTGGPSAGKSTIMAYVSDKLTQMGYLALTVPEAPTLCIMGGIHPGSEDIGVEVGQTAIIELNLAMKEIWEKVIRTAPTNKNIVVMYDRFIPDCKGYMPIDMYKRILQEKGVHEAEIISRAKGIVFLVTAAFGPSGFTRENNPARREDSEGARQADLAIRDAWIGGPPISVIEPQEDFELKKLEALQVVLEMLGEPVPIEKEKKYVVRYRGDIPGVFQDSSITQFYCLSDDPEGELRMRQRITDGYVAHYQTKKVPNPLGEGRIEHETQIPAAMFRLGYESFRDKNYGVIGKRRRCFMINGKYHAESDKFDDYALMDDPDLELLEIQYTRGAPEFVFPPWIELVADVTDNPEFKNSAIAKKLRSVARVPELM